MNQADNKGPCQHRGLARSEAASVVICEDCGNLVVSFSCLSIRMALPAFRGLVETLVAADSRLDRMLAQAQTAAGLEEGETAAASRRH